MLLLVPACERSTHGGDGIVADNETTVRGESDRSLTVSRPHDVTLQRGKANSMRVRFDRHNFDGPVTISVANLPAGVEAVDVPRQSQGDDDTIVLQASDRADLVENHQARISLTGPDGMQATETFEVSVKQ
jgi:hypothetical protein